MKGMTGMNCCVARSGYIENGRVLGCVHPCGMVIYTHNEPPRTNSRKEESHDYLAGWPAERLAFFIANAY